MMASALTKQKGALRKAMRATLANLTSDEIQAQCTPDFPRRYLRERIHQVAFYLSTPDNTDAPRPSGIPAEQERQLFSQHAHGRGRHLSRRFRDL